MTSWQEFHQYALENGGMDDYDYDPCSRCPECGERMQMDTDGDYVMTMSYEFCENCGTKDYGEPVRIFEQEILPRLRAEEEASKAAGIPPTEG